MSQDAFLRALEGDLINRPRISQMVIEGFANIVDAQDQKGWKKYGKTIDDAKDEDYCWKIMALEEAADQMKYLTREIIRLENELKLERSKQK